ncbi:MAG: TIM-barrel domain-containing protein, partial [Anaerolineae bacterium]|nr:TIM-barrel domain-containing protein [Anaerolineae bacterium]
MLLEQESLAVQKGFQRLEAISLEKTTLSGAQFLTQAGILEVSFYAPGVIRLRCAVQPENDYQLLVNPAQQVAVSVQEIPGGFCLTSGKTSLEILSGPLRLRLLEDDRLVLESVTDRGIQGEFRYSALAHSNDGWLFSFALKSAEPIYGLGEKFSTLNKRGQLINAWNRDALGVNSEASYKNMPFAWSPEGWGLFLHTTARVITGAGYAPWSHRTYITKLLDPNLDLFLISAQEPAEILEKYIQLTGRAPLPPLWSYGVWMSRAYYRTAEEILEVADQLRKHNLP